MSKKLKKRIRELAGLEDLSKEERIQRCRHIIEDTHTKQQMCNKVPGMTFKDIEKVLKGDITNQSRQPDEEDMEWEHPEKLAVNDLFHPPEKRHHSQSTPKEYTREEVHKLLNATSIILRDKPAEKRKYSIYSFEEVAALMVCDYKPVQFKRKTR